ncbi:MAG: sel1 repeat family protein [Magnetococcales bacterium]|nr:sel1 repeat family protein [Magnetococcales bacterium]
MAQLSMTQRHSKWFGSMLLGVALGMVVVCQPEVGMAVDVEQSYKLATESFQRNDWVTAMGHLQPAADAQHVPSMLLLAYVLDRSENDKDAIQMYRKAAMLNSAEGALGLGEMLAGTPEGKKNPAEALEWINRAAKLGHPPAMMRLAINHLTGNMGMARDPKEAEKWLEMAAKEGFAPATYELQKLRAASAPKAEGSSSDKPSQEAVKAGSDLQKEVEGVVEQWAKARSDKNLPAYRALYSASFQPPPVLDPKEEGLMVSELRILMLQDGKARALFNQQAKGEKSGGPIHKALSLNKEAGGWKIVKEEVMP